MTKKERLVIIGAGFGGLTLAKNIDKNKYDVTIVDRRNYHSFPPLFYQVARAASNRRISLFRCAGSLRAGKCVVFSMSMAR